MLLNVLIFNAIFLFLINLSFIHVALFLFFSIRPLCFVAFFLCILSSLLLSSLLLFSPQLLQSLLFSFSLSFQLLLLPSKGILLGHSDLFKFFNFFRYKFVALLVQYFQHFLHIVDLRCFFLCLCHFSGRSFLSPFLSRSLHICQFFYRVCKGVIWKVILIDLLEIFLVVVLRGILRLLFPHFFLFFFFVL